MENRNYITELINYFRSKENIISAYFGQLYSQEKETSNLFLAIKHTYSDDTAIKNITWQLKIKYFPNIDIFYTSSSTDVRLLEMIESNSFPFYRHNAPTELEQKIIEQHFYPELKSKLIEQIENSTITALFKDFDTKSNILNYQTYIRDEKEFIPLFSNEEMISKCGMKEIPENLTVINLDLAKLSKEVDIHLPRANYILNPSSPFEIEFTLEDK